ncbi:nitric-oxide reductase large subunit, partial [Staphylococcus haemolyticus]
NKIEHLSDFFFWGAWLSSTDRPDRDFSYTNNWPFDEQAGNTMASEALIWSAISVAILVAGVAIIIYFQRRYQFDMESTYD